MEGRRAIKRWGDCYTGYGKKNKEQLKRWVDYCLSDTERRIQSCKNDEIIEQQIRTEGLIKNYKETEEIDELRKR